MDQQVGQRAFLAGCHAGFFKGGGFLQLGDFTAQTTLGAHQLKAFGNPDGPGDDRGDGQADHHELHDDIGILVHAPRRQVMGHAQRVVGFQYFRTVNLCAFGRQGWGRRDRCHGRGTVGCINSWRRCCSGDRCRGGRLIGESRGRGQQQAEHQCSCGAEGARWTSGLGWRSGLWIACHAGRT
ncbi:hypothetical protein D3C84_623880 [compost metagenome]